MELYLYSANVNYISNLSYAIKQRMIILISRGRSRLIFRKQGFDPRTSKKLCVVRFSEYYVVPVHGV